VILVILLFTQQVLEKELVLDLKASCKKYNIKLGSKPTKVSIIQRILQHSTTIHSKRTTVNNLLAVLKKPALKDPATHFNLDDLTDCKWYAVEECHSNH
jgi:hypothetical protein